MLTEPESTGTARRPERSSAPMPQDLPANPVLVRLWRGEEVESLHRGSWALVDPDGRLLAGQGATTAPIFARSSTKALQALPLVETGAAEAQGFSEEELALALASHNGEPCHTRVVSGLLGRLELGVGDLRCGAHRPQDHDAAFELRRRGEAFSALHNNCSGKHAAFLALGRFLGEAPESYIDPASRSQLLVRQAVLEMTGCAEEELQVAVDGCSAPTFRMPLERLALGFARFTNPEGLSARRRAACERLAATVAAHPTLIGGTQKQICSAIAAATGGRLFPKIGAEAVYVIGERGGRRALAIKMDDGGKRGLTALILHLLERFDLARPEELAALARWAPGPLHNHAGLVVGRTEVVD